MVPTITIETVDCRGNKRHVVEINQLIMTYRHASRIMFNLCCMHVINIIWTRQVTRATHVRNRVCPRVELILKIIIIFLGFIKSLVNRKQ